MSKHVRLEMATLTKPLVTYIARKPFIMYFLVHGEIAGGSKRLCADITLVWALTGMGPQVFL